MKRRLEATEGDSPMHPGTSWDIALERQRDLLREARSMRAAKKEAPAEAGASLIRGVTIPPRS